MNHFSIASILLGINYPAYKRHKIRTPTYRSYLHRQSEDFLSTLFLGKSLLTEYLKLIVAYLRA